MSMARGMWGIGIALDLAGVTSGIGQTQEDEFEEEARRRKEEEERRERDRLAKLEKERVEHLLKEAENWRRAADLRSFVEIVRKESQANASLAVETLERWSTWVLAIADRLDPIRAGRIPD